MKRETKVLEPIPHDSIFNIFFAEGFTHAVNEMTPALRLDINEFAKLIKPEIHDEVALMLVYVLAGYQFVHEPSFPAIIVRLSVGSCMFASVIDKDSIISEGVGEIELFIPSQRE